MYLVTIFFACLCFVGFYSGVLGGIGVVITLKGVYNLINPPDIGPDHYIIAENYNRLVLLTYIIPGCIMIWMGAIGYQSIKLKLHFLTIYTVILITIMSVRVKGEDYSLYAYFGRVIASRDEFGLLTGIIYPEYGIHICMLIATLYLIFVKLYIMDKDDDDNGNNTRSNNNTNTTVVLMSRTTTSSNN